VAAEDLPASVRDRAEVAHGSIEVRSTSPVEDLHVLCAWLLENEIDVDGVKVSQPTLEDVYLQLTSGVAR
jgi:hypothetical protein